MTLACSSCVLLMPDSAFPVEADLPAQPATVPPTLEVPNKMRKYTDMLRSLPASAWPGPANTGTHSYTLVMPGKPSICIRSAPQPATLWVQPVRDGGKGPCAAGAEVDATRPFTSSRSRGTAPRSSWTSTISRSTHQVAYSSRLVAVRPTLGSWLAVWQAGDGWQPVVAPAWARFLTSD